jgi:hypothetical protein
MTFDGLKYEKDKFRRRTISLNPNEIEWVVNRILKENPNLEDYKMNKKHEEELLSIINFLIYDFEKNNPPNIREYVEKELKKKEYDVRLSAIWQEVSLMKEKDLKRLEELKKQLDDVEKNLKKEFPEYYKELTRKISSVGWAIHGKRTDQQIES